MKRHEFFKSIAPKNSGLIVPEMAISLKNDCKEGKWVVGETDYGSKAEFFIIHFSRRIGFEIDRKFPQGQIWVTPVSGEIPSGIIYYTLIKNSKSGKSGSLRNFGQQVAIAQSQGFDPRELVWCPKFVKKSGAVPDENGIMQAASWYVLDFSFRVTTETEWPVLENCVTVLSSPEKMDLLFDPDLEISSICIDGMTRQQVAMLMEQQQTAIPSQLLPGNEF